GISEMESLPDKPYAEFKLAVVGPLVSLVLSGAMWLVYSQFKAEMAKMSLCAYWLADMNLVLGLFNLIPALPLDGGRALRSFLAVKQGVLKATENSVKVSEVISWILGFLGLIQLNFFLILIAFFVYSAAQSELILLMTKAVATGVKVRDAMVQVE